LSVTFERSVVFSGYNGYLLCHVGSISLVQKTGVPGGPVSSHWQTWSQISWWLCSSRDDVL